MKRILIAATLLAACHRVSSSALGAQRRPTLDAATMVFAVGQLRDTLTIAWLDSLLSNPRTPPTVALEAACALGKIKTAAARDVLARYLSAATTGPTTNPTIGEALLSIGRSTARGDIAPIVKWATSADEEVRWRAAYGRKPSARSAHTRTRRRLPRSRPRCHRTTRGSRRVRPRAWAVREVRRRSRHSLRRRMRASRVRCGSRRCASYNRSRPTTLARPLPASHAIRFRIVRMQPRKS